MKVKQQSLSKQEQLKKMESSFSINQITSLYIQSYQYFQFYTIKISKKDMTLNVPVNNNGIPLALPSEHFLLYRSNIEFQVKIDNLGKKSLKGTAFLTSHRIIFVSQKPTADFWSFDIHIATLFGQNVQFPLFGNTYLKGSTTPYQNLLPGNCHFKLWFMNGGCDGFIKNLDLCIKQIRKFKGNMQMFTQNSGMYSDMRNGNFRYKAYVDPNDPSQVFMEQPKPQ